jgi:hypothetical protein
VKRLCTYRMLWLSGLALLLLSFITGCDNYQAVTFENQTNVLVEIDVRLVPKDYTGKATFKWTSSDVPIKPGQSVKFITSVPSVRSPARYVVQAINERSELVFSQVFTWDELHEANWRVVIQ